MFSKSDGSSLRYQIEAKQTKHKQIALKLEWLEKISGEAYGRSRLPLLALRFLVAEMGCEKDWVVIPQSEFKKLYDLAKGDKEILGQDDWSKE